MQPISHPVYSRQEIIDAIHGVKGMRDIRFRYDLLDKEDSRIGELDSVIDGEVSLSSLADIKRTAKFTIHDTGDINWLSDRIQPYVLLKMPEKCIKEFEYGKEESFLSPNFLIESTYGRVKNEVYVPSQYIHIPMGVFLLGSPTRGDQSNRVIRQVDAYDGLLVLRDDKFESRYFVAAGTNYRDAVIGILESAGITKHNIEQTDEVLTNDKEFEPGREKLFAINELLGAVNFTPVHVDVHGYYTSFYYRSPAVRASEYVYADNIESILSPGMEEEFNLVDVANRWVVTLSNPEEEPLVSSYTNDNPDSLTSTANRGRIITDFRELENIASQEALDAYVQRIAFEASQVYGKLKFSTAINPFHDYSDVLDMRYSPLGIYAKYSETAWTIPLKAGALMTHEVRRVVQI